ncbi:MAG: hypothetical protein Q8P60_10060 [Pseudorhodobacter sp.]|nr:hypothetical protein [Pseudorhodobacter sp.]
MTGTIKTPNRLLALLCTTALLAAMPLTFSIDARTGVLALQPSVALADSDGGNDHGDNDGGNDHDGNDHDGNDDDGNDDDGNDNDSGDDDSGDDQVIILIDPTPVDPAAGTTPVDPALNVPQAAL